MAGIVVVAGIVMGGIVAGGVNAHAEKYGRQR